MQKITLKLILLCIFSIVVFSLSAQTSYYEDFLSETEARGFTVQRVNIGGQSASLVGGRVSDVVDASDSSPVFDVSSRPTTRIPQGGIRDQRAISFSNASASTNYEIEAWALMTNQDFSVIDDPKVSFWTEQRFGNGTGATLSVLVSQDYTHGNAPSTANWTDETANIVGAIATLSASAQTYVKGELDLSAYTGTSVTVAFKVVSDDIPHSSSTRNGTFYISDVKFEEGLEDVADGAFSALNTSSTGQTNIFNTPSASITETNFSNTNAWANIFATSTSVPRLAQNALAPIDEGYKFEVSSVYNPIIVTEMRYRLANGTSNQGSTGASRWIVQGSNDDSIWDDLSAIFGMYSANSVPNTGIVTLTTAQAYRYYRIVLETAWTPSGQYTALQEIDFTIGAVLPVDLLSFTADEIGKNAELTWITVFELNSDFVVVEKSVNGLDFEKLGTVNSVGNSTERVTYKFIDDNFTTSSFYRLKQVDLDGQETLSSVIKLEKKNERLNITVGPNPFTDMISISSNSVFDLNSQFDYSLNRIDGRLILKGKTDIANLELRLNNILRQSVNGVYFLKIGEESFKLVKE